jgi:hypothetical protein
VTLGVSSCNDKYGDDLRGIGRRVEILEDSLLSQNISIEKIKKILDVIDKNGYVKAVIKNPNGSYTIQFSNGTSVVLHDGTDGKDGRDASADEFYVSVAKGEDGAWYWTVNGEFIIGEDGNPMRASAIDGKDGKDGKDDIDLSLIIPTSRINPVTRIWEISTDGGITYVSTGILADGRDGISTQTNLGVAKGEDGVWYWTFNGTWILDESGNRLRANGIDGKDGKDDINLSLPIPITRINSVTRIWEISLDNGVTFTSTGIYADGKDGATTEANLSASKGEDGALYWTFNGKWIYDKDGNRIRANGIDGKNGKDDIDLSLPVPITRINPETRFWEISLDNGATYTSTGVYADGKDGINNLMTIYGAVTGKTMDEITAEFAGKGYGDFKTAVGEAVADHLEPVRSEFARLIADKAYLTECMTNGAQQAYHLTSKLIRKVYRRVGFIDRL